MGFVVLIAVGVVLGWTASILTRTDGRGGILVSIAAGLFGALVGGALASNESLLIGLSAFALMAAIGGSIAALAALYFVRIKMA